MEAILLIALIFFGPKILKALVNSPASQAKTPKSSKQASKWSSTTYSSSSSNSTPNSPWKSPEFQDLKKTLQEMSGTKSQPSSSQGNAHAKAQRKKDYEARQMQSKAAAARRVRRLKAHDASHGDTVEGRDISDNNKNRRADWGARVGPGILNAKTFMTAVVFGLILVYLMSVR